MPEAPPSPAPGAAEPPPGAGGAGAPPPARAFQVRLPPFRPGEQPFEGPLDLLLHLVQEHQVDLFDIPVARITEAYLATLQALRELDIDLAGEFLQMAAQLLLMKSRLLLPRTEVAEDAQAEEPQGDPRAELVRRLLEYQKYKAAAEELGRHDVLDRDVFARRARADRPPAPEGPEGLADVSVFKLVEALDRALRNARPELSQEIATDRLSITDAIGWVAEVLKARRRVSFRDLLAGPAGAPHGRTAIIATFLALLEMARLQLVRVLQPPPGEGEVEAEIVVEARETLGEGPLVPGTEDYR
jgi:segregation and condensation protein A